MTFGTELAQPFPSGRIQRGGAAPGGKGWQPAAGLGELVSGAHGFGVSRPTLALARGEEASTAFMMESPDQNGSADRRHTWIGAFGPP
jgi:hypothetical protein